MSVSRIPCLKICNAFIEVKPVGHGVAHGVLVFEDEPDSDLGVESGYNESIDEENCT